jgi:homoserine acetyltransferase
VNTNAQAVADKWATRASAAATDYVAGAQATDKDPTQLAINAAPRWFAKLQDAYNNGRYQQGLARAGKTGWLAGVTGKGKDNYANGVNNSKPKVAAVFGQLLPFEANLQQQINQMPNVTDADKEARAIAWMRGMRNFQKTA